MNWMMERLNFYPAIFECRFGSISPLGGDAASSVC